MYRDYLAEWPSSVTARPYERISKRVQVDTAFGRQFGGMAWDIEVSIDASPSDVFSFQKETPAQPVTYAVTPHTIDEFVFGMIDALATNRRILVFGISIRLLRVEPLYPHPAPPLAFQMAGRHAARLVLEEAYTGG